MRLAVNIDHIATLRNARGGDEPDPIRAAQIVEKAGADGIVCHLREDRRHIRDRDVRLLRKVVQTKLDLEMAATPEIIQIALQVKPDLATLVPERREELTTEGGLDLIRDRARLRKAIQQLHDGGIAVSLFIDPVQHHVEIAKELGADKIEIHTGEYAEAGSARSRRGLLVRIREIAQHAQLLGLGVNAGHGLNYTNVIPIVRIREIEEVSIGHAIIARAAFVGLEKAVTEMVKLVKGK